MCMCDTDWDVWCSRIVELWWWCRVSSQLWGVAVYLKVRCPIWPIRLTLFRSLIPGAVSIQCQWVFSCLFHLFSKQQIGSSFYCLYCLIWNTNGTFQPCTKCRTKSKIGVLAKTLSISRTITSKNKWSIVLQMTFTKIIHRYWFNHVSFLNTHIQMEHKWYPNVSFCWIHRYQRTCTYFSNRLMASLGLTLIYLDVGWP